MLNDTCLWLSNTVEPKIASEASSISLKKKWEIFGSHPEYYFLMQVMLSMSVNMFSEFGSWWKCQYEILKSRSFFKRRQRCHFCILDFFEECTLKYIVWHFFKSSVGRCWRQTCLVFYINQSNKPRKNFRGQHYITVTPKNC